jgi:hypothetical protein
MLPALEVGEESLSVFGTDYGLEALVEGLSEVVV